MSTPSFLAHYDKLLAAHYTWMAGGDYHALTAENRALFERLGITAAPVPGSRALDLGCGSGFQSAALLGLGYTVIGVDLCGSLVEELRARNQEAERTGRLTAVIGDLLDASLCRAQAPLALVVCMGDTLTHLSSHADVARMIANAAEVLAPGGRLVLRFRDLTGRISGLERFIPVRADADKIMTCFLEEAGAEHMEVTDLIYLRNDVPQDSAWRLEKSSYQKLRISGEAVETMLAAHALRVSHKEAQRNLLTIVATKLDS